MIYLLVGPIASGKSTYSREQARKGALIINDDAIVDALHAGIQTLYSKDIKLLYKQLEMVIMTTGVALGKDIVIDRPSYKKATRARYVQMAKAIDHPITAVIFPNMGPEVHAERRFKSDPRGYDQKWWTRVAKEHQDNWQDVEESEGFDDIIRIQ